MAICCIALCQIYNLEPKVNIFLFTLTIQILTIPITGTPIIVNIFNHLNLLNKFNIISFNININASPPIAIDVIELESIKFM